MAKFQLWKDGMLIAVVECESRHYAMKEIAHYAAVYEQDGPVKIIEVKRRSRFVVPGQEEPLVQFRSSDPE